MLFTIGKITTELFKQRWLWLFQRQRDSNFSPFFLFSNEDSFAISLGYAFEHYQHIFSPKFPNTVFIQRIIWAKKFKAVWAVLGSALTSGSSNSAPANSHKNEPTIFSAFRFSVGCHPRFCITNTSIDCYPKYLFFRKSGK